jgi:hypothetical protein
MAGGNEHEADGLRSQYHNGDRVVITRHHVVDGRCRKGGKDVFWLDVSRAHITSSEVCKQYRRWAKAQRKSYRIMLSKQLYSCSEYIITAVKILSRGVKIFPNISAPRCNLDFLSIF